MRLLAALWALLVALWNDRREPRPTYTAAVTCLSSKGYEFQWLWRGVVTRSDGKAFHSWVTEGDSATWQSFDLGGMRVRLGEVAEALNDGRAAELVRIRSEHLKARLAGATQAGSFVRPDAPPERTVVLSVADLFEAASLWLGQQKQLPAGPGKALLSVHANGTATYEYWPRETPLEVPRV